MCGPFLLFIKELAGGNWSVLLCVTLCWKNLTEWLIMPASPSFMCYCAHGQHQRKLVFYTQSTGMVISGRGNIKGTIGLECMCNIKVLLVCLYWVCKSNSLTWLWISLVNLTLNCKSLCQIRFTSNINNKVGLFFLLLFYIIDAQVLFLNHTHTHSHKTIQTTTTTK